MSSVTGSTDEPSDDELMIRLQRGDNSAFQEIVLRHESALVGYFRLNTRDLHLAEDLTQETLLKLFRESWDYLPLGRFRGWMFRIARNLLIDDVRRKSHDALILAMKRPRHDEGDDGLLRAVDDLLSVQDIVDHRELKDCVEAMLTEIPDEQRQAFTLHHYGDLSMQEVASIMEVPLATCKSRLRLAREKLASLLRSRGFSPTVG